VIILARLLLGVTLLASGALFARLQVVSASPTIITSNLRQGANRAKSSLPRIRLQLLLVKPGVPLMVQTTITGPSLCMLNVTAIRSNGTRKVMFTGADDDGPRRGEYVGNYMVLAKVPPATKLIMASATCRYSTRGRRRRVKLSASIFVK
jgi:hypothetical protein